MGPYGHVCCVPIELIIMVARSLFEVGRGKGGAGDHLMMVGRGEEGRGWGGGGKGGGEGGGGCCSLDCGEEGGGRGGGGCRSLCGGEKGGEELWKGRL